MSVPFQFYRCDSKMEDSDNFSPGARDYNDILQCHDLSLVSSWWDRLGKALQIDDIQALDLGVEVDYGVEMLLQTWLSNTKTEKKLFLNPHTPAAAVERSLHSATGKHDTWWCLCPT